MGLKYKNFYMKMFLQVFEIQKWSDVSKIEWNQLIITIFVKLEFMNKIPTFQLRFLNLKLKIKNINDNEDFSSK